MMKIEEIKGAQIRVPIKANTQHGEYSDTIYYSPEAIEKLTEEDLAAEVKRRVDNWHEQLTAPPVAYEPTKAELELHELELHDAKYAIEAQLADVQARIAAKR